MTPSIRDFFQTIFNDRRPFCTTFTHQPQPGDPWPANSSPQAIARRRRDAAEYYCTAVVRDQTPMRRRMEDFEALAVLVLDDVKQKAPENALPPSYRIETSPGSEHWGYLLEPWITDADLAERFVYTVYTGTGLTDEGGKMATKMVRAPAGRNWKNGFVVHLAEWAPERRYSWEQILEAWGLTLVEKAGKTRSVAAEGGIAAGGYTDRALDRLGELQQVVEDTGEDWVKVLCPWGHLHTAGDNLAGYSPLGRGPQPNYRGFHCFHEHCAKRRAREYLDHHDIPLPVFDPVELLRQRYGFVQHGSKVVDLKGDEVIDLADFRNRHAYRIEGGEGRGAPPAAAGAWLSDKRITRLDGFGYDPKQPKTFERLGRALYNRYRTPVHPPASGGDVDWFLEHVAYLIPEREHAEIFLDWLAKKLQAPWTRSYAVLMVGETFGIGRSLLGQTLVDVWQSSAMTLPLSDLLGTGQGTYNEWAGTAQLVILDETREEASDFRLDTRHYERFKYLVDPLPRKNMRVAGKYSKIYVSDFYANFLFFSNHEDALQLPHNDRRFFIIKNPRTPKPGAYFDAYVVRKDSSQAIADLYAYLMAREVTADLIRPPMTAAKLRMVDVTETVFDELEAHLHANLPGLLIEQASLMKEALDWGVDCGANEQMTRRLVRRIWKKLSYLPGCSTSDESRVIDDQKPRRCRVWKDYGAAQELMRNANYTALAVVELNKNVAGRAVVRVK